MSIKRQYVNIIDTDLKLLQKYKPIKCYTFSNPESTGHTLSILHVLNALLNTVLATLLLLSFVVAGILAAVGNMEMLQCLANMLLSEFMLSE